MKELNPNDYSLIGKFPESTTLVRREGPGRLVIEGGNKNLVRVREPKPAPLKPTSKLIKIKQ